MAIDGISGSHSPAPGPGAGSTGATSGKTGVGGTQQMTELDKATTLASLPGPQNGQGNSAVDGLRLPLSRSELAAAPAHPPQDQFIGDAYSIVQLFDKTANEQRAIARESRDVSREPQTPAIQQSVVEEMKNAAARRLETAGVQGETKIATIGSGLVQTGVPSASAAKTLKGATPDAKGNTTPANPGASLGAKTVANSNINIKADLPAKGAEPASQHARDMEQQLMDVMREVRDKQQSIQQAAVETNRGIARNV